MERRLIFMNHPLLFPPQIIYEALLNNYKTIKNQNVSDEERNKWLLVQTIEDCKLEIMDHTLKISKAKNIDPDYTFKMYLLLEGLRVINLYKEIDFFKDDFENHLKMLIEIENKHLPTKI